MTWVKQDNIIFIGCPQPNEDSIHTRYCVDTGSIDVSYLEHMVLYGSIDTEKYIRKRCSFWDISASKRKNCRKSSISI